MFAGPFYKPYDGLQRTVLFRKNHQATIQVKRLMIRGEPALNPFCRQPVRSVEQAVNVSNLSDQIDIPPGFLPLHGDLPIHLDDENNRGSDGQR